MKYVHTNIITDDWKRLAQFYIQAFSCKMTLPQRDLSGEWLSRATGVHKAHIKGAHLRLPGWGNQGPTLEIFQYTQNEHQPQPLSNRKGLGHLAFEVEDVEATLEKALAFGGERYGEVAVHTIESLGTLTVVYLRDPDGNIIELQNWGKPIDVPLEKAVKKVPAKHTTDDTPKPLKEDVPADTPPQKELPSPSQKPRPLQPSADLTDDDLLDPALDKRAYMDALNKDLDDTRDSVNRSKAEIKASKEALKYEQQQLNRRLKYTPDDLEEDRPLKKDKNELLQDLQGEMNKEDLENRALPVSEQPTPPQVTPLPVPLTLPKTPAQLQVELKIAGTVSLLDLTKVALNLTPEVLAERLRAYTSVVHPQNGDLSFLEYLGKQYRADLVPLVKVLNWTQDRITKEKAWILIPRLKGSLHHLLEQCEKRSQLLKDLGLEQMQSSPEEFIEAYQELLKIAEVAEAQGAIDLRLAYSAKPDTNS